MPHAQSCDETTVIIQIDGSRSVAIRYETTIRDGMVYATLNKEDIESIDACEIEDIGYEAVTAAEEFHATKLAKDLADLRDSLESETVKRLEEIGWIKTTITGFEITKDGKEELENYADR